jgi:hypothetical protein
MKVKREVCHTCLLIGGGSRVVQEETGRCWDGIMGRREREETDMRSRRGRRGGGKRLAPKEEISSIVKAQ